jgi:hypothetical protein
MTWKPSYTHTHNQTHKGDKQSNMRTNNLSICVGRIIPRIERDMKFEWTLLYWITESPPEIFELEEPLRTVPTATYTFTEKRNRLEHTNIFFVLQAMIRKLDSNGSVTCHNRSTTFLTQLIRSLVTSDFLLFSNDIDHLVQVFGIYCAECSMSLRVIDFVFQCWKQ